MFFPFELQLFSFPLNIFVPKLQVMGKFLKLEGERHINYYHSSQRTKVKTTQLSLVIARLFLMMILLFFRLYLSLALTFDIYRWLRICGFGNAFFYSKHATAAVFV